MNDTCNVSTSPIRHVTDIPSMYRRYEQTIPTAIIASSPPKLSHTKYLGHALKHNEQGIIYEIIYSTDSTLISNMLWTIRGISICILKIGLERDTDLVTH